MQEFETKVSIDESLLTSDIWAEEDTSELLYKKPLADCIQNVAEFLFVKLKKVARHNRHIFGQTLSQVWLDSVDWKNKKYSDARLMKSENLTHIPDDERWKYLKKTLYRN